MSKKDATNDFEIGVLLSDLELHQDGTKKVSLEADVLEVKSVGDLRNPIDGPFEDLQIRMTVWPDPWHNVTVQYHRVYSVDERRAKQMLGKLTSIRRKLEKFRARLGNPADATDDFMRTLNAIGVTWIVEKTAGTSCRFAENEYRFLSLQDGAGRLRHLLTDALARLKTPAAPTPALTAEPAAPAAAA